VNAISSPKRSSKRGIKSEDATPLLRLLFRPSSCKRSLSEGSSHILLRFISIGKEVFGAPVQIAHNNMIIIVNNSPHILLKDCFNTIMLLTE
jgi:hypothetical protein